MIFISENNLAALLGTSNYTAQRWAEKGVYTSHTVKGVRGFNMEDFSEVPEVNAMLESRWKEEFNVIPLR